MTPEGRLEAACRRLAKAHGWLYIKVYGEAGFPDRIALGPRGGRLVIVESKTKVGALRRKQAHYLADLKARGFRVAVVRAVDEFKLALRIK